MNLGQLKSKLYRILIASSNQSMQDIIDAEIQYQYFELCKEHSWARLRCDPVTLDFSTITSGGMQLPSDLLGIDLVWDDTNSIEFWPKNRPDAQVDGWGYRYYLKPTSTTDLASYDDLQLDKGASSFTSAALTSAGTDPDGEYVMFDDEPGFYKITSSTTPFTFTPAYHGENRRYTTFRIRPWETTWDMVLIDEDEDALYDRSVDVYYWRAPQPLYRDSDIVIVPFADTLFLRVLLAIPQAKQHKPVSQGEMESALRKSIAQNPDFPRVLAARDKRGMHIDMNTNPFKSRNS